MKSTITILIEGSIVGLLLLFIYEFTKKFINIKSRNSEVVQLFISGFLFHILCQLFGINKWYVDNYYK